MEKIILQREKEHCSIFIRTYLMWSLRLGLGLSWGVELRLGLGLGNRLNNINLPKLPGLKEKKLDLILQ